MANLKQPKSEEQVKALTVAGVKKEYLALASDYNKIINNDYMYCHKCNSFLSSESFYSSKDYASSCFPICKKCLLQMATDYEKKTNTYTDNKEKTKMVLQMMNLPFIDSLYNSALTSTQNEVGEKNRKTAFQHMITILKSLPQYKNLTYADSEFELGYSTDEDEIKLNQKTIKAAKKRFGLGYSNEDLMFLENEYQDWVSRYECNTKAQEEVFQSLAAIKLQKKEALKSGKPTKELDRTFQEWLDTGNLKPKQNTMDTMSDAQTFGTLIQKYEETRPLPEIDPELEDIDKIGLYIDSFYRGHACKMLGIKNSFSHLYEKVMNKYTVTPPEYDDETDSEILFEKIFGSVEE